jgi:hypothetical protein
MNLKQILILIGALIVSALILWHDLPIDFPWIIHKVFMLFLKLSAVLALTILSYIFAAAKKGASGTEK